MKKWAQGKREIGAEKGCGFVDEEKGKKGEWKKPKTK